MKKPSSIVLYSIVLVFLSMSAIADIIVADWKTVKAPFEQHKEKECKIMYTIVLDYLEKGTPGKRQSDWEDRVDDNIETLLNAVKADTYMRVYLDACNPTSTYREIELMKSILRLERGQQ